MEIINYDNSFNKNKIVDEAFEICMNANFPVTKDDVYNHLFGSDSILKLLVINGNLKGFGVFNNYELTIKDKIITMLYLSGMVIDKYYQGSNLSREIIKSTYKEIKSDLISLRTQNIAMAKSFISSIPNEILMPGNNELINDIRCVNPFKNINEKGIISNCYENQLYYDLSAINNYFNVLLNNCDALGIVIKPKVRRKIYEDNDNRY